MPTIIPNSTTILSIYPVNVEHTAMHNGIITYKHPAAKRDVISIRTYNPERLSTSEPGRVPASEPMFTDTPDQPCEVGQGYTLIRVYDTFTWSRDMSQDNTVIVPHPLSALELARSLVSSWASDVIEGNGAMGPGIMVIEGDAPTEGELANVRQRQNAYARTLINSAKVYYAQDKVKDISGLHRAMAEFMGVKNVPWLVEMEQVEMKVCRACGERIRAAALKCKECQTDLVKFYSEHGLVPDAKDDPAVFAFMDKSTGAKAVTPKSPTKAA